MKSSIKVVLGFVIGAAIGAYVTNKMLKEAYAQLAQDEIDSVKEVFSARRTMEDLAAQYKTEEREASVPENGEKPVKAERPRVDYTSCANSNPRNGDIEETMTPSRLVGVNCDPYVIPPDEFGDDDEQEKITLYYWADQVLTDENYEPVEDVEATVGFESLTSFGQYEEDATYVRNLGFRCDYEILIEERRYDEFCRERAARKGG